MNAKYWRLSTCKWEDAIVLKFYGELGYFVLRWSALLKDFEEVLVPPSRLRF